MKILLVQAYLGEMAPPVFPLGLSCLVTSLKNHEVKIFDPNISKRGLANLTDALHAFQPEVVGISLRNIDSTNKVRVVFYYKYLKQLIDIIKSFNNGHIRIIIGGPGFSMFAREIMKDKPRIDYGVFLEGEEILPELINNIDQPELVKGVFYRKNGKISFTGPASYLAANNIPTPDRSAVKMGPYIHTPEAIGVESKRGCEFKCAYCVYGFLDGNHLRLKNPEAVVDEIEKLAEDRTVKYFTFVDAVFNIPLFHAEAICHEIIKRQINISWSAWFHNQDMSESFVRLVKKAGCSKIILSPDGFSDHTLRMLNKGYKKPDILRTYKTLKKIDGIEICYNYFKNPPGQSLGEFIKLLSFCIRAKLTLKNRIHFEFNSIRIEPHTLLCQMAREQGMITEDDDLLQPHYYSNPATLYLERLFDLILRWRGK